MSRITSLFLIIYIGTLIYIGYMNHQSVDFVFFPGKTKEIPLWMFAFISSLAGAFFVFILYAIRDTKRLVSSFKEQKKQKRIAKLHEQFSKALSAINKGQIEEAKKLLETILKQDPNHREAIIKLAELYESEGKSEKAEAILSEAYEKNPSDDELALFLARVRLKNQKTQEALQAIDSVIEQQPMKISALLMKRQILENNKKWHDLIELQRRIITIRKTEDEKQKLLGYMHEYATEMLKKDNTKEAMELFREILKEEKEQVFAATHLAMAEALYKDGRVPEAIDYLENIFKKTGSFIVLAKLEELLLERSSPSRILDIYREALERWQDNETLKFFLGKLYYRLEMLDDAMAMLSEIDEDRIPHIKKIKGMIYLKRGQPDKAAAEFKEILDIKNTLKIPYKCTSCGAVHTQYSAHCLSCGAWNSYCFEIEKGLCVF